MIGANSSPNAFTFEPKDNKKPAAIISNKAVTVATMRRLLVDLKKIATPMSASTSTATPTKAEATGPPRGER
jgi:hypothetical protein